MHRARLSITGSARAVAAACWLAACLCAVAAPVLASHACVTAASLLYVCFSRICHQIPERSFHLFGYSLAVCHRCFGIYAGLFIGCFVDFAVMRRSLRIRRMWILGATAPLILDALGPVTGCWDNSAFSRLSTGLLFGTLISSLVVRGLDECVREAPWRRFTVPCPPLKGDIS